MTNDTNLSPLIDLSKDGHKTDNFNSNSQDVEANFNTYNQNDEKQKYTKNYLNRIFYDKLNITKVINSKWKGKLASLLGILFIITVLITMPVSNKDLNGVNIGEKKSLLSQFLSLNKNKNNQPEVANANNLNGKNTSTAAAITQKSTNKEKESTTENKQMDKIPLPDLSWVFKPSEEKTSASTVFNKFEENLSTSNTSIASPSVFNGIDSNFGGSYKVNNQEKTGDVQITTNLPKKVLSDKYTTGTIIKVSYNGKETSLIVEGNTSLPKATLLAINTETAKQVFNTKEELLIKNVKITN